jgi:23S rRNA pseudouridine1911/1915/1917 synthase
VTERELVVHLDARFAVVDKPAGLVVHPAPGHRGTTLADELGELLGGGEPGRAGIVHRLDKDTSGLMLVARDDEAHRRLAAMIKRRKVGRAYLALVEGRPASRSGTIDAPLGRDHRAPQRRAVRGRGAREARTHFEVIEALPEDSLVEARLETGHPVAGDPRYGHAQRHGLERQFLHSARLELEHPFSGVPLRFRSELPDDLAAALGRARAGH